MKKLLTMLVVFFAFSLMAFTQSPVDIYEKYKDQENVESIVINEELFEKINEMNLDVEKDAQNIIEGLDNMIVMTSSDIDFESELDLKKYEELLVANDGVENVKILAITRNDKIIKKIIILASDGISNKMVYIEGNLDLEDITKIAEGHTH